MGRVSAKEQGDRKSLFKMSLAVNGSHVAILAIL